jgi:hypothetical protein
MLRFKGLREDRQAIQSIRSSMIRFGSIAATTAVLALLASFAPGTALYAASLSYTNPTQTVNQIAAITTMVPTVTGVTGTLAYSVASGSLPAGVALNPNTGYIGGAAMVTGNFSATITVAGTGGPATSGTISITVNADGAYSSGWNNSLTYVMNPNAAGITANLANFPVLIRLTSTNSAIFSGAMAGGADLRFAKGSNTAVHYPYQIQRWDATRDLAEVWVLVDTVFYQQTQQSLVMYWGNSGASAASSGPAVFSPGNGFLAVWHGSDTSDATGNGNTLATKYGNPAKTNGLIDSCYNLTGAQYLSTSAGNLLGSPQIVTESCWADVTTAGYSELMSMGDCLDLRYTNPGIDGFVQCPGGTWPSVTNTATYTGAWDHFAWVVNPGSASAVYANGVSVGTVIPTAGSAITYNHGTTVGIGADMFTGGVAQYYLTGYINEARVENVARSANWVLLNYKSQLAAQTFVASAGTAPTSLTYTNTSQTFTQITPITSMVPTVGGSPTAPLTYSVTSGALPAGVALNPTTGYISGAPMVSGAFSATITVTNVAGSAVAVISGTVNVDATYSSSWSNSIDFFMNPNATGITTNQIDFPVLIRLTSANAAAVFTGAQPGGADLRFAKGGNLNVHYPYQIQRWNATNDLAEIWVLVDTVFSGSTSQDIKMYWGNSGALAASSGPAVFNAGSGYAAVWHLSDQSDACGNLPLNGAPLGATSNPTTKVPGIIDSAYTFNGTSNYFFTSDSTSTNASACNFSNGGPFTLSAWAYFTGTNNEHAILDKGNLNWELKMLNSAPDWGGLQYVSGTGFEYCQSANAVSSNAWHQLFFVRSLQGTSPAYAESVYVDGSLASSTVTLSASGNASVTTHAIAIGNRPEQGVYWWAGNLDEAEVSTVGRSHDWIKLSYANQQASQTLLVLPSTPTLSLPANNAGGVSLSLTLSWNSVSNASTYAIRVSTSTSFTTTVTSQTGVAGLSASVSGLAGGTTYYWEANATNGNGASSWSNIWSFTTVISTPGAPTLALPSNNAVNQSTSPTLSWSTVAGAATYNVLVSTSTSFTTTVTSQTGAAGLSASVSGLANSTPYYWEVSATNAGGTSAWSSVWSFTTVISTPGAPTLAAPTNNAVNQSTSLTLSWGTIAGATSYNVLVSTSTSFATTVTSQTSLTTLSATVSGLANNTPYYWEVNATNVDGTGAWSSIWSFTTIIALPGAPVLASPSNNVTNQLTAVTLNWSTATGATSYNVLVSTSASFTTTVSSQSGVAGLSASVSGLANSTPYYWEVSATNAGGTSAWSSVWSFTTIIATPVAPYLALPLNNAVNQSTSPTLSWSTVAGATSYNVLVSTSTSFATTVSSQTGLTALSATVSGLANSTPYYWEVNATNADGAGAWSSIWSFTTIVATSGAPTLVSPTDSATSQATSPTLSWSTVTGGTSYNILVSSVSNFGSTVSSQTGLTTLSATVSGLANATLYYWEVSATNAGGTGSWSSVWSFTTVVSAPGAPALSSPTSGPQPISGLTLSWASNSAGGPVTSYQLQVTTDASFTTTVYNWSNVSTISQVLPALIGGISYYWEVGATGPGGGPVWAGPWTFTTVVAAPPLASPTNGSAGQSPTLSLSWGSVNGAVSYGVQVSTDIAFGSTVFGQSGLTALSSGAVIGLSGGTTYYWEVNAVNASGTGAWSVAWSFTTSVTQVIPLNIAWNMKSLNVIPPYDTSAVFGTDPAGFLFVKDNAGDLYCPYWGQDDLHYVQVGQGYQLYTNVPDTINVQGIPVNYANTPIALSAGWNMIAYLPPTDDSIAHAMASIVDSVIIIKNNSGRTYWPSLEVDGIGVMAVGEGYKALMSANVSFTYPAPLSISTDKRTAASGSGSTLLHLPDPCHYAVHANTGNNATLLAINVMVDNRAAKDSSEIGAYDPAGNLVGSGTVIHGRAAFAVWGADPISKKQDGCTLGAMITFKLWDGVQEYPLNYSPANGVEPKYAVDAVYLGSFSVPSGYFIKRFDLTNAYPNPFRGSVKIAFDVPTIAGVSEHSLEINVYDLKGSFVKQLATGKYQAGHYTVAWNCNDGRQALAGSSVYIVRMKAPNFDKRLKLIRIQ